MQRTDILFLIRSMERGGAERQLSLLARTLHARGKKVTVAVFYAGGALEHELHEAGVEVLDLEKRGRWSNLDVIRRLMAFARKHHPRVLHSYMPAQNLLALLMRPWLAQQNCAVVCGIRIALPNAWRYSKVSGVVDWLQAALLQHANLVISNSSLALRLLGAHIGEGKGVFIPNGIECERFAFSARQRASQRTTWNVADSEILLGLVGRLDPQKHHALLIDALHFAKEAMADVKLVFVGDGSNEYRNRVREHAKMNGMESRILWAGACDNMAATYSALDMLCLCSVHEGFPNVLAEAMSAGLPCVSTDVGDAAALIGDCGWVVPSDNVQALSQALQQAYHALPDWNRERPRRRMADEFSVGSLADRTLTALAPYLDKASR